MHVQVFQYVLDRADPGMVDCILSYCHNRSVAPRLNIKPHTLNRADPGMVDCILSYCHNRSVAPRY